MDSKSHENASAGLTKHPSATAERLGAVAKRVAELEISIASVMASRNQWNQFHGPAAHGSTKGQTVHRGDICEREWNSHHSTVGHRSEGAACAVSAVGKTADGFLLSRLSSRSFDSGGYGQGYYGTLWLNNDSGVKPQYSRSRDAICAVLCHDGVVDSRFAPAGMLFDHQRQKDDWSRCQRGTLSPGHGPSCLFDAKRLRCVEALLQPGFVDCFPKPS